MNNIELNKNICSGCGICAKICPFGAIKINEDNFPEFNDECVFCGDCIRNCPKNAITFSHLSVKKEDLDKYRDFWVVMEINQKKRQLKKASLELLSKARDLANKVSQRVIALALYHEEPKNLRENLIKVGCDVLYIVKNEKFERYNNDIYTDVISGIILKHKPSAVLFAATETGRDLAPRISGRLKTGLTADCISLDMDNDGNLVQIRPTFGGNIIASIICPDSRPQMATIRPNVFDIIEYDDKKKELLIKDIDIKIQKKTQRIKYKGFTEVSDSYKDVEEAEVIVAGGFGMGSKENFKLLNKLATKLGGAVGASRKVVDEGWAPSKIQVGQTGRTVAPDIYIACGISGALQHIISIKKTKTIIVINNDPSAPIFSIANIGIIGDAVEIVGELCRLIDREEKSEGKNIQKHIS